MRHLKITLEKQGLLAQILHHMFQIWRMGLRCPIFVFDRLVHLKLYQEKIDHENPVPCALYRPRRRVG